MLEDAVQATVNADEGGFQHVACMAKRCSDSDEEEGCPQTFETNSSPVCRTVYEDDDVKHVVVQQAKKTHHPVRTTLAKMIEDKFTTLIDGFGKIILVEWYGHAQGATTATTTTT